MTEAEYIKKMTDEYLLSDGYVTVEFSSNCVSCEMISAMHYCNNRIKDSKINNTRQWKAYFCKTCYSQNENSPIHIELA